MNGQWIGEFSGSTTGSLIVNIDDRSTYYQGVAYIRKNAGTPSVAAAALFRTVDKSNPCRFRTGLIAPIDPGLGAPVLRDAFVQRYQADLRLANFADVVAEWNNQSLKLTWVADDGLTGEATLPRSKASLESELIPLKMGWKEFKEYVATLERRRFLFRGQNQPWRLRTSFHRAGRADLYRFMQEDIPALHRQLSARTKHVFNLSIADENGAFYNLIQHHGYPTPLLDWTYSPYVAAFFAYRGVSNWRADSAAVADRVRIQVFDQAGWRADFQQILMIAPAIPHVSIGEFIAIENERLIPQQAASTVTSVDDIEGYIQSKELDGRSYLSAIDLPVSERRQVVQELGYMGITAGALFPGLDGACEELKERHSE